MQSFLETRLGKANLFLTEDIKKESKYFYNMWLVSLKQTQGMMGTQLRTFWLGNCMLPAIKLVSMYFFQRSC